jgi:hypothetical protein
MLKVILALVICLVGLVMYIMHTPPPERWKVVGLVMFAVGLLVCTWIASTKQLGF